MGSVIIRATWFYLISLLRKRICSRLETRGTLHPFLECACSTNVFHDKALQIDVYRCDCLLCLIVWAYFSLLLPEYILFTQTKLGPTYTCGLGAHLVIEASISCDLNAQNCILIISYNLL